MCPPLRATHRRELQSLHSAYTLHPSHVAPPPPTPAPYPIPLILPLPLTLSPTPTRYLLELQSLQDRVPPFPNDLAFEILEAELGRPIAEVYSYIGPEPVAAASLGQVYRATLLDGTDVAVKVQRPGAEATIALDLYILRAYSRTLMQACLLLTTYHLLLTTDHLPLTTDPPLRLAAYCLLLTAGILTADLLATRAPRAAHRAAAQRAARPRLRHR